MRIALLDAGIWLRGLPARLRHRTAPSLANLTRLDEKVVPAAPGMAADPASGWPLSGQRAQLVRALIRSGLLTPGPERS